VVRIKKRKVGRNKMALKYQGASYELTSFTDKISTDSYVTVGIWSCAGFKTKVLTFTATDNNLLVSTAYSNDGTTFTAIDADVSVTTAALVTKAYSSNIYAMIRVQVKSAAAGTPGTLSTKLFGTALA
jgi:hypothetical protein